MHLRVSVAHVGRWGHHQRLWGSGSVPTPAHCVNLGKYMRKETQGGQGEGLVVFNRRATTYERNGKEEKVSRGGWKEI